LLLGLDGVTDKGSLEHRRQRERARVVSSEDEGVSIGLYVGDDAKEIVELSSGRLEEARRE
jgi:hypothetical protein